MDLSIVLAAIAVVAALMIADLILFEHRMKDTPKVHRGVYVCLAAIGGLLSLVFAIFSMFSTVALLLGVGFSASLLLETKHIVSERYWYATDQ